MSPVPPPLRGAIFTRRPGSHPRQERASSPARPLYVMRWPRPHRPSSCAGHARIDPCHALGHARIDRVGSASLAAAPVIACPAVHCRQTEPRSSPPAHSCARYATRRLISCVLPALVHDSAPAPRGRLHVRLDRCQWGADSGLAPALGADRAAMSVSDDQQSSSSTRD